MLNFRFVLHIDHLYLLFEISGLLVTSLVKVLYSGKAVPRNMDTEVVTLLLLHEMQQCLLLVETGTSKICFDDSPVSLVSSSLQ